MTTLTYSHLSNCLSRLDGISSMCAIFTIHRTRWSINWPTSVKPLDHYTVYIGNVVIGNWLILTRLEEQTTTLININIILLVEAACPYVCSIVASVKTYYKQHHTPEITHCVCSSLFESRETIQVAPALVWLWPAVWPSGQSIWRGLLIISSFNENSTGVAMCAIRQQNKGSRVQPQLFASWICWQT